MDKRLANSRVSNPYREFISRARCPSSSAMKKRKVSNPYREFISRAPAICLTEGNAQPQFQTPIGNSSRAHMTLGRGGTPGNSFQTPIGNSSRAHGGTGEGYYDAGPGFKPLSGIHLARTMNISDRLAAITKFQTPIGNSSRAHGTMPVVILGTILVSNPYREFISRARFNSRKEVKQQ